MDPKILLFNENQLKKCGFGEAFTNELKAKMELGISPLEHKVRKEIQGHVLEATLHLKKSTLSDYYSLKKFDLQLQKESSSTAVMQTFQITDPS